MFLLFRLSFLKYGFYIQWSLLIALCCSVCGQQSYWPEVSLSTGQIRGRRMRSANGKDFFGFIGIPYAAAPLGPLRFRRPVDHGGWRGTLQTTTYKDSCPQFDSRGVELGSEDCLYLNVYTPSIEVFGFAIMHIQSDNAIFHETNEQRRTFSDLYPVMVYIQAESFENGDSSLYGPEKLLDKGVIVVTFNYRLGILGFLSTEDEYASGNWGLYDQNMALQWVKTNIASFGGDQNSITLFGQGAGAASVFFHILSPLSRGLFNKAILQSGSGLCHWAIETNALQYAKEVATIVGCPTLSTSAIVDCLRNIPPGTLLRAQTKGKIFGEFPQRAAPIVERTVKSFLPDTPRNLLLRGDFNRIPLILGVNKDETSYFYPLIVRSYIPGDTTYHERALIPKFLEATTPYSGQLKDRIMPPILHMYFDNMDHANISQVASRFINMSTDALYWSCIDNTMKLYWETGAPVYMYLFDYKGSNSMVKLLMNNAPTLFDTGVCHGDELFHIFDLKIGRLRNPSFTDNQVSQRMLTLWTDFAKYGYAPQLVNYEYPKWELYHPLRLNYYRIGRDLSVDSSYRQREAIFWSVHLRNVSGIYPSVLPIVNEGRTSYKTLAWAMVAVSITLLILVIALLSILYYQRRSQSFKAQTPENGSSHLSTGAAYPAFGNRTFIKKWITRLRPSSKRQYEPRHESET